MKKSLPKPRVNNVFFHKEEQKQFIVTAVDNIRGNRLVTFKEISANNEGKYKRCYVDNLNEKYEKVKNSKAVKLLYGKKV